MVNKNESETRLHLRVRHEDERFQTRDHQARIIWWVRCSWPGCVYGLPEEGGLLWNTYPRHIVNVHVDAKRYFCPRCEDKSYSRQDALLRHMKDPCIRCKHCHATDFRLKRDYDEHMSLAKAGKGCCTGRIAPLTSEGNSKGRKSMKEGPNKIQKPMRKGKGKEVSTATLEGESEPKFDSESKVDSEYSYESEEGQSVAEQLVEDEEDQLDEEEYN